jgi:hypothetical protein
MTFMSDLQSLFAQALRITMGHAGLLLLLHVSACIAFSSSFLSQTNTATRLSATTAKARAVCATVAMDLKDRKRGALLHLQSSADYILDSFDPEEEEDELSNEVMLRWVFFLA